MVIERALAFEDAEATASSPLVKALAADFAVAAVNAIPLLLSIFACASDSAKQIVMKYIVKSVKPCH